VQDESPEAGGWLYVLVWLLIVVPILTFGLAYNDFLRSGSPASAHPEWQSMRIGVWALMLGRAYLFFMSAWKLTHTFDQRSVNFTLIALWVGGPLISFLYSSLLMSALDIDSDTHARNAVIFQTTGSAIWAVIWSIYLSKSKRVNACYPQPEKVLSIDLPDDPAERREAMIAGLRELVSNPETSPEMREKAAARLRKLEVSGVRRDGS
jgi:hypothetical protein